MDNNDNVIHMFGHTEDDAYVVDDTVNIPRGEYEELIEDSVFLFFLEQTVGPEVWDQALTLFDEHIAEMEDEGFGGH